MQNTKVSPTLFLKDFSIGINYNGTSSPPWMQKHTTEVREFYPSAGVLVKK
jgi:hypothetical protein